MPNNISDFANQVNTRSCPSGAIYSTALNADGSLKIFRAASASAPQPGPVYAARVVYIAVDDKVIVGDGSGDAVLGASGFISGLN